MMSKFACTMIALGCLLGGCGLSKPFPEKKSYAFAISSPEVAANPATAASAKQRPEPLRVMLIRAFQPYDGLSMVYKTGDGTFTTDYYNTFIASPDRLLTAEVEEYLSRSGLFSTVTSGSTASYRYLLQGDLVQLYGDFSDKAKPTAVMSLRFFLIDDADAAAKVLLQKTYRQTQPIRDVTPASLMAGWNKGLETILQELEADIEQQSVARGAVDSHR